MIKKILNIILLLSLISLNFGITVVENTPIIKHDDSSGISQAVAGGVMTGVIIGTIAGVIILIIWLIIRNIRLNERKQTDLLYSKFKIEQEKCNYNRDRRLKWRNWRTFFLTYKRAEILLDTQEGLKFYGFYDGEMIQKDKFFLIASYKVVSLFKRDKDIIIIPYELKNRIKKELINGKWILIIKGESIDEVLNTDYYSQVVFKDENNDKNLISFSDYIQKEYMEKFVLRQTIRDNLLDFKTSMDKAVELNPNVQVERKNPKN